MTQSASSAPKRGKAITKPGIYTTFLFGWHWLVWFGITSIDNSHLPKGEELMFITGLGVTIFGLLIGIFTYQTRLSRASAPALSDLIALGGIVISAAVVTLLRDGGLFGWYAIGLALGLLASFAVKLFGQPAGLSWRIPSTRPTVLPTPPTVPPAPPTVPPAPPADPSLP